MSGPEAEETTMGPTHASLVWSVIVLAGCGGSGRLEKEILHLLKELRKSRRGGKRKRRKR
jgi:hypothetical protein